MTTMTNIPSLKKIARKMIGALVACTMLANANGAETALSTEPFTLTDKINALPNIMFVLDDSGSMKGDFLPDWAGPYQQTIASVLTTITPPHRFFNNAYNGVAYNPGSRYRPPVMYTNTGALDTTTYPSMTGESSTTGGDGSATSGSRNWKAVKVDGFGIQSASTVNIEGNAFSYTTIPGEYCTSKQLRTCTASASPTGSYTEPAYLRWCTTSALSTDTTANAGTSCQASNIADTPTNTANGVTNYTFARMPRPRTATITVTAAGSSVTDITVGGLKIISAAASGASTTALATDIAARINDCTYQLAGGGTGCTIVGYSATSVSNVVTVTAPGAITSTPVVTGATTSVTAFSGGNVPGASLLTVITPSVTSYPYPGLAIKGENRTDCALTTCTYEEEMTNYANWYAYYHTRMQMMKSGSSIAFSNVDDKFRVGYYSINNASGSDFLAVDTFTGAQKFAWYSKFFAAVPYGATPLRTGLANVGRMYAYPPTDSHVLNGVAYADPLQYSCQQNYTILSTDGYWNDTSNPKRIDGTTDIGQQDNNDPRPYYDGATQTRTVSQTTQTDLQIGINTLLLESMSRQQQTSTSQLDQVVVTKDIYPWTTQTSTLQTRTTPLDQTEYSVRKRIYPLTSATKQLQESAFKLNSTPRILQSYINNLTKTTTPLEARTYNVTKSTQLITKSTYNLTVGTQLLTKKDYNITKSTQLVTKSVSNLTVGTKLVTQSVYNLTKKTYPLQQNVYTLTKNTSQLQKRQMVSTDGGDTYADSGWVNASTCSVTTTGVVTVVSPSLWTKNTTCQYATPVTATAQTSCTTATASTSPNYTVAQAVTCSWETPATTNVGTCAVSGSAGSGPTYNSYTTCTYSGTAATLTGQATCSALDQTGAGTMTGDKVTCAFDTTPTNTTNLTTCTNVNSTSGGTPTSPKTTCAYQSNSNATGQTTCTVQSTQASSSNTGTVYNAVVACSFDSTPTNTTNLTTCTNVNSTSGGVATSPKTTCAYQTATDLAGQTTCTASGTVASGSTSGTVYGSVVTCGWDPSPATTTTNLASCTSLVPGTATTAPKSTCTYQTATNATGQATCAVVAQTPDAGSGTVFGTAKTCVFDTTPTTTPGLTTCTNLNSTSGGTPTSKKETCAYQTATNLAGQTSCTAQGPAASGTTTGTVFNQVVTCAYDGAPTTTLTNQANCTWVVPSPAASLSRTDCAYNAGAATTATVATCTPVAQSTGTTNGTVWAGPAVSCAYAAAVLQATNLTTCTAGTPSGSAPYLAYTTCGYINGTTTTGLNSCTYAADSPGPINYTGPKNACAYSGTATVSNVTSCTAVAQDLVNFSAPAKTCAYEATSTPASGLSTCTDSPQSSGAYPWVGPNVTCAYSGSTSSDTTVASCTVNQEAGPSYSNGARVRCTYNTGVPSSNVSSCSTVIKQTLATTGAVWPTARDCAYGTTTGWANATVACVPKAQDAVSPYTGPGRECQYTSPTVDTFTATCLTAAQDNVNLTARNCVPGSFPVTISTVASVVDSCSTAPTTDGASPVERITNTTCAYRAPVVTDTATCTTAPVSGGSPYTTAVTCPITNAALTYVPAASCTPAGIAPATLDGTGKVVDCRKTDQIGTTTALADYSSFVVNTSVPVASCTAGVAAGVHTLCTTMLSTGPSPVQTCTNAAPTAPSYVKTTCNTTNVSTTVMGCSAPAATAPAWETVTCAYDGTGTLNTLADVAAYYYKTDLRTFALGNCTGSPVPPAATGNQLCSALDDAEPLTPVNKSKMNNVSTSAADPLPTQHMTTFTLGLGASGYMKFSDKYVTDTTGDFPTVKGVSPYQPSDGITANPSSGVCSWQANGLCNWPVPASDEQTTIDDLWHAGVNGHGAYFSATDPDSLSNSISQALAGISAGGGAAAAPTISTPRLAPADNYIFSSKYVSGDWSGELERYQIDPYSGIVTTIPDWAVTAKLDANTSRNIYTFDSSVTSTKLRAFTSANFGTNSYFNKPNISTAPTGLTQFLCASVDTCLSATNQDTAHASGANLVNYLRGDRTNEGALTDNTKYYRQRVHVLGDMVNAQVVYVTSPLHNYGDPGYAAFKAAKASRQAVVYAGANDGMLHAFAAKGAAATETLVEATAAAYAAYVKDGSNPNLTAYNTALAASNAAVAADTVIGQELWAYIPSAVLPNLYHLADKNYKNKHRYYVDATPIVDDVCVADCSDSALADWRTILVGGLGRGGRAFFVLDITNPASPKALWEFSDANLGYSYGNSQIAKLSNGTWVVMFTSGYNNIPNDDGAGGDGVGRLFVVNALTGAQITTVSPISTGAGDVTTPSGLSKITAQVVNPSSDNTIEAVYGGDTLGNLWRFDPNGNIGVPGYDAQLLAVLKDGSGNTQPITTKPEVGLIQNYKVVFVGTGRFLNAADANDTGQQTLYAIKDARTGGATAATAIFSDPGGVRTTTSPSNVNSAGFVRQIQSEIDCPAGTLANICAPNTKVVTSTNYPVDFVANNGWFVDLIHSSERANTDPALALGLLAYNTNAPSLLACVAGGKSYSYYLNYLTGGPIYSPGNGDPSLNNGVVGQWLADAYASSPSLVVTEGGDLLKITGLPNEIKTEKPPLPPPANVTRRTSWRELIKE